MLDGLGVRSLPARPLSSYPARKNQQSFRSCSWHVTLLRQPKVYLFLAETQLAMAVYFLF